MTESVNPFKSSYDVKTQNQGKTDNSKNNQKTSVFQSNTKSNAANDDLQDEISRTYDAILEDNGGANFSKTYDVPKKAENKTEQEKNTTFTKVKAGKKDGKPTGLYQIELYADESQEEPKEKAQCFIFETGKDEKKFKFKTGNGHAIDFKNNGNDISVEVSNGNRKAEFSVQKNKDGTYEVNNKTYNSIEEMAVALNKLNLKPKEAADGEIDASMQAAHTGDCSLLSALNSISHSGEAGQKVINDAFDINEKENKITVNLPGFNSSYTYKLNDLQRLYGTISYSTGDVEAYFLERAINDALDDVKSGKIKLSKNAPAWCKQPEKINKGRGIANGVEPEQVFYALTGLECNNRMETANNKTQSWFDKNSQKEGVSIVASRLSKKGESTQGASTSLRIKDAFGKSSEILKGHAYAVKDVSTKTNGEKVVTVIDPYDSSREIIMDEATFMDTFNVIDSISLKGNNKRPKYYN